MAAAENAKHCVAFASGSAATSAVVHLLSHGQSILCIDDVYGGTQRYFRKIVNPAMNINIEFLDFDDMELIKEQIASNEKAGAKARLLWLETPTNPTLKVSFRNLNIHRFHASSRSRFNWIISIDLRHQQCVQSCS